MSHELEEAERLDPRIQHKLGNVFERYGTAALFVVLLAIVPLSTVYGLRVLLADLGIWACAGVIFFLMGELLQEDAKQRLERSGDSVPESWHRTDGTKQFFDRWAGDLLRTPVVDLVRKLLPGDRS